MSKPLVGIIMGSESDGAVMAETAKILKKLKISFEVRVLSAHRSPARTKAYARRAEKRGLKLIIAGAGGAAHLAGVIASETVLPVIGVPMQTKTLKGVDSLYSTVQMPSGIPVGTMAIGKAGARNAALFSASILSLERPVLKRRIKQFRRELQKEVIKSDKRVKEQIY